MGSEVRKIAVALHKSGVLATVSYTVDEQRYQLVVPVAELPPQMRSGGQFVRDTNGTWVKVTRIDGAEAVRTLRALFGAEA
jgi:hypothetical protein